MPDSENIWHLPLRVVLEIVLIFTIFLPDIYVKTAILVKTSLSAIFRRLDEAKVPGSNRAEPTKHLYFLKSEFYGLFSSKKVLRFIYNF